jgi:transcriptional regulator GlxA family with amidase domain
MKKISILVPKGAVLNSIESSRLLFAEANNCLINSGRNPIFDIKLTGQTTELPHSDNLYRIYPEKLIYDVETPDLIIIPALQADLKSMIGLNKELLQWIRHHYSKGAEVASLCVGAFLLASTGLLNDKTCTTHWQSVNEFKTMFPDVRLTEDKILTEENGVYTSAGGFSSLNLLLYLIEKYAGRAIALSLARLYEIDIERRSQSPFILYNGFKNHTDIIVRKTQELIESNPGEKYNIDRLAELFTIGRRNLERRFKKATATTIVEYIQRIRIEAAKRMLETTTQNINEVMYRVGYSDLKAFRMLFKKYTGVSPMLYRIKYQKSTLK